MSIQDLYYELSQKVGQVLKQKAWKLVTAESCTGGQVAQIITRSPGSSEWFERGFITYSNESKIQMLGVSSTTIETYGAVSQETALQMAEGALEHSLGQVSIAVTGIAGPLGGSTEKPVGSVWFACSFKERGTMAILKVFEGDRQLVQDQAAYFALSYLLELI